MGIKMLMTGVLTAVVGGLAGQAGTWTVDDMPLRLSEYHLFEGRASDLRPSGDFKLYELATTLFTDYAEKQRLIRLPPGGQLRMMGDGLPVFPEGTVLVKTFYYYNDRRDTSLGRRLIETRVMVLSQGQWKWGTYLWNAEGTEALLFNTSSTIPIGWRDQHGVDRRVRYAVPSHAVCANCHNVSGRFMPIGPTGRNLRFGSLIPSLPAWQDSSLALVKRVSAYLDVNCAHCHNPEGYCAKAGLDLRWGAALPDRREFRKVVKFMRNGRMPLTGTTIVHQEGLVLMEEYFQANEPEVRRPKDKH